MNACLSAVRTMGQFEYIFGILATGSSQGIRAIFGTILSGNPVI